MATLSSRFVVKDRSSCHNQPKSQTDTHIMNNILSNVLFSTVWTFPAIDVLYLFLFVRSLWSLPWICQMWVKHLTDLLSHSVRSILDINVHTGASSVTPHTLTGLVPLHDREQLTTIPKFRDVQYSSPMRSKHSTPMATGAPWCEAEKYEHCHAKTNNCFCL